MTDFTVTDREAERLARQAPLELMLPLLGVAVVGCGGVGSWLALFLAFAGVQNLWLWDHDTVSDHNLNRLPVTPDWVRKPKADALAATIKMFRPECKPVAMGRFDAETATTIKLYDEINWIVATTDTWASRRGVSSWAAEHNIAYIEAAAEGEWGSITNATAEWATDEESQPGYASVPVWVGPCVGAAMMATAYIIHDANPGADSTQRLGFNREAYRMAFFDHKSEAERQPIPSPMAGHWILEWQNMQNQWFRSVTDGTTGEFASEADARQALEEDPTLNPARGGRGRVRFIPVEPFDTPTTGLGQLPARDRTPFIPIAPFSIELRVGHRWEHAGNPGLTGTFTHIGTARTAIREHGTGVYRIVDAQHRVVYDGSPDAGEETQLH